MIDAFRSFWSKAFVFGGRTSRADFWLAWLANIISLLIVFIVAEGVSSIFRDSSGRAGSIALALAAISMVIPFISMQIRRLRDAGFSPWLYLVGLIPWIGSLALLVLFCFPSRERR